MNRREALIVGGVAVAAAAAGAVVGTLGLQSRSGAADLLGHRFLDLEGRPRRLIDWRGQVLAVNFWATWCAPCREEMPILEAAHQRYRDRGASVVGIGIDSASKMRDFAANVRVSYPLLVGDASTLDLMRAAGNPTGGLPFTVFLDRAGAIAQRKIGALHAEDLAKALEPLLG